MKRCEACGKPLGAERGSRARFCDGTCRVRFSRGHRPEPVAVVIELDAGDEDAGSGLVSLEQVAAELQRVLMATSTPASSKAGLAKELRAVMVEIAKQKPAAKSLIDQLAERRAKRAGA